MFFLTVQHLQTVLKLFINAFKLSKVFVFMLFSSWLSLLLGLWLECDPAADRQRRVLSNLGPARRIAEDKFLVVTGKFIPPSERASLGQPLTLINYSFLQNDLFCVESLPPQPHQYKVMWAGCIHTETIMGFDICLASRVNILFRSYLMYFPES